MRKIFSFTFMLATVINASAQSILQDYFKGNKDSMLTAAYELINLPEPGFPPYFPFSSKNQVDSGQVSRVKGRYFKVRDGKKIFAYRFLKSSTNTIILLHGVKSSAFFQTKMAGLLRDATGAEVYALDIRGHGRSEGADGDVDYIGQYADDVQDVIQVIRGEKPGGKIILAGHSMGGGIALQHALGQSEEKTDAYLLFAPLIGHNAPTIKSMGSAAVDTPFMQLHIARIIGLKMLNELNNHQHDHLPVLFFNLPENTPSRKYSYRADMSMAPEDYQEGLKAVQVPMLVLSGTKDEVFEAEALKKAVEENSSGTVRLIEGATHNSIRHDERAFTAIKAWYSLYFADSSTVYRNKLRMSWEFAFGNSRLNNNFSNKHLARHPVSFQYQVLAELPLKKFKKAGLGFKCGLGLNLKNYAFSDSLRVVQDRLLFFPFSTPGKDQYSNFRQFFLDMPLRLVYERQLGRHQRGFSAEAGIIPGWEIWNEWRQQRSHDNIRFVEIQENVPQTLPWQLGASLKLGVFKNRPWLDTQWFVAANYFFTDVFKSSSQAPAQSFTLQVGLAFRQGQNFYK